MDLESVQISFLRHFNGLDWGSMHLKENYFFPSNEESRIS